jgi:hypothetical protein
VRVREARGSVPTVTGSLESKPNSRGGCVKVRRRERNARRDPFLQHFPSPSMPDWPSPSLPLSVESCKSRGRGVSVIFITSGGEADKDEAESAEQEDVRIDQASLGGNHVLNSLQVSRS